MGSRAGHLPAPRAREGRNSTPGGARNRGEEAVAGPGCGMY